MKPIAIAMPDDLVTRLDALAAAADRSRSQMVRRLIEAGFAHTNFPAGASMSGQTIDYDALRRDQLAAVARGISERIAPPTPEPKKENAQ
jgi:predicted transcriptional regulator